MSIFCDKDLNLILASASPRRSEIMKLAGYDFKVVPSFADETVIPVPKTPHEFVEKLSRIKAEEVFSRNPDACVIGADTVVVLNDNILGKPKDDEDAFLMLKSLSGNTHTVYTGVSILSKNKQVTFHEATFVTFNSLSDDEIRCYLKTSEHRDKAGAYGIQGYGSVFVSHIEGCYFNVMGLPISRLYNALKEF